MAKIDKIMIHKTIDADSYKKTIYFNVLFRNRLMMVAYVVLSVMAVLEIIYCALTGFANNMNFRTLRFALLLRIKKKV